MIRRLEELSFNAWPALQTVYYDGWLLRLAGGYTRRANSVNPIYPSSLTVREKILYCEAAYAVRRQDAIFKITPAVQPEGLDTVLEGCGYRREAATSVQILDLEWLNVALPRGSLSVWDQPTEEWISDFCLFNGVSDEDRPTMERMLASIVPATIYVALKHGRETAAVGLAVRDREYLGLFDIVTATQWRGQGIGTQLVSSLLQWGHQGGARHAYLQVMTDNAPALSLYRKLGFSEAYRYWYRRKTL